jgi:kinesin family member C2/C3
MDAGWPLNLDGILKDYSSVVDFDPLHETELQIICTDSSKKQFKFDHVFGPVTKVSCHII